MPSLSSGECLSRAGRAQDGFQARPVSSSASLALLSPSQVGGEPWRVSRKQPGRHWGAGGAKGCHPQVGSGGRERGQSEREREIEKGAKKPGFTRTVNEGGAVPALLLSQMMRDVYPRLGKAPVNKQTQEEPEEALGASTAMLGGEAGQLIVPSIWGGQGQKETLCTRTATPGSAPRVFTTEAPHPSPGCPSPGDWPLGLHAPQAPLPAHCPGVQWRGGPREMSRRRRRGGVGRRRSPHPPWPQRLLQGPVLTRSP